MRKHRRLSVFGLAIVALALIGFQWAALRGPTFNGETIPEWIGRLPPAGAFNDPRISDPSTVAFRAFGSKAIPYLARAAFAKESVLRKSYAKVWTKLPGFMKARLREPADSLSFQRSAAWTLAQMADQWSSPIPEFDASIPMLVRGLDNSDPLLRYAAVYSLVAVFANQGSPSANSALVRALNSQYPDVRRGVAEGLSKMGSKARFALPALIKTMDDPNGGVRVAAAWAVYQIGNQADGPVRALKAAMTDPDRNARANAALVLTRMGPSARGAVPDLIRLLSDPDVYPRTSAAQALEKIAPENETVIAALLGALRAARMDGNWRIAEALWNIAPQHTSVIVPAMTSFLTNSTVQNRHMAARLLGRIGESARPALSILTSGLTDSDKWIRLSCAFAILRIGSNDHETEQRAMNSLITSLKLWGDEDSRSMSARFLGELGGKAVDAKPHLQEALSDGVHRVRDAAAKALEQINSVPRESNRIGPQ